MLWQRAVQGQCGLHWISPRVHLRPRLLRQLRQLPSGEVLPVWCPGACPSCPLGYRAPPSVHRSPSSCLCLALLQCDKPFCTGYDAGGCNCNACETGWTPSGGECVSQTQVGSLQLSSGSTLTDGASQIVQICGLPLASLLLRMALTPLPLLVAELPGCRGHRLLGQQSTSCSRPPTSCPSQPRSRSSWRKRWSTPWGSTPRTPALRSSRNLTAPARRCVQEGF